MYNYNSTNADKTQGIFFNTDCCRWEYYGKDPVVRGGEPQPEFVSEKYEKCLTYKMTVERS